jgi:hypothetical protein
MVARMQQQQQQQQRQQGQVNMRYRECEFFLFAQVVARHPLHVTRHTSHVTHHNSHFRLEDWNNVSVGLICAHVLMVMRVTLHGSQVFRLHLVMVI